MVKTKAANARDKTARDKNAPEQGARDKLVESATDLLRRQGYVATTVDQICAQAGVTKGAFFHYFESKEALAHACLERWGRQGEAMDAAAPYRAIEEPVERALACIEFYAAFFSNPRLVKSCLAGTTVQEVAETNPALRDAAQACFVDAEKRFKSLLDEAFKSRRRRRADTASLATLWMSTIQGSLLLSKASRDASIIRKNFAHLHAYIKGLLGE
ncbi:MAG: TetR/AcrR family transcriptional regulator [Planctomycetia bacterium]|nr:TetR/AcrR family transcriptional regulator [Planctomycetia bacterium]